jgi:hypothetical protein
MHISKTFLRFTLAFVCISAQAQIDLPLAHRYFEKLKQTSDARAEAIWGVPLYGPIFFVDPSTNEVVANQADPQGVLKLKDWVWTGKFPANMNAANSAIDWLGVKWTMVMWPVNDYRQSRERLLLHECFHRIQDGLNLPARDAVSNHLDTADGRIWLELEWRALERALRQSGPARKSATADALLFRAYRRSLFPDAAVNENHLELNEGLAEYTGVRASSEDTEELVFRADRLLRDNSSDSSFARSFAYTSGPAYGALLDSSGKFWRKRIASAGDFGKLVAESYAIAEIKPDRQAAIVAAARYEGEEIIAQETRRAKEREEKIAAAQRKFIASPALILPLSKDVQYSFNPNDVMAVDSLNTVYPTMRLVDTWGTLDVSDGAWLVHGTDGSLIRAQVPAPQSTSGSPINGDGWSLSLNEGWKIVAAERAGDFKVANAAARQ